MANGRDSHNGDGSNGKDKLLTQKEASVRFQVAQSTISSWVRRKKLRAVRMPSGRYRVRASEIAKYIGEAE